MDGLSIGSSNIKNIKRLLTLIIVVVCVVPPSMFTVRQFQEQRVILNEDIKLVSRLIDNYQAENNPNSISYARELIHLVIEDEAEVKLLNKQQQVLFSLGLLQRSPKVNVNQQTALGNLQATQSIADRLPFIFIFYAVSLLVMTLGLFALHRRVFPRWEQSEAKQDILNARLVDIASLLTDWFWELDSNFRIAFVSTDAENTPYLKNINGKKLWELDIFKPLIPWSKLRNAMNNHEIIEFVVSIEVNESLQWFQFNGKPLYEGAHFIGYRGTVRNITNEQNNSLRTSHFQEIMAHAMGSFVQSRDNVNDYHIIRTKNYVKRLTAKLQQSSVYRQLIDDEYIQLLYQSVPLYDIGKAGISDTILCKPGSLNVAEFAIMKTHTSIGYEAIVRAETQLDLQLDIMQHAKDITLYHHEKWDGSGYPYGLEGENIPLSARLIAIVDVYDALISSRVYKSPKSHDEAVEIMVEGRGTHFDPYLLDTFLQVSEDFKRIARRYADDVTRL